MAQQRGEHGHDGHGHGGHDHGAAVTADSDRRLLLGALALILAYMLVEVVIGLAASSIALISDAGHMLTDAFSLVLALGAMRLAAKPAHGRWTFGFKRAEILSAQANGITLLVLVGIFVYESIDRLLHPPAVNGALVTGTAVAGLVVNAAAALLINRANRTSLNVEGAFQHILNDAWAFLATAVAGIVVMTAGFDRADAIASLVVAALMAKAGYGLVRESWKVLLEAAPEGVDPVALGARLRAAADVVQVHDLHVWTITSGFPALSAHVLVAPGRDCHAVRMELEELLHHEYDIEHTTLQVEHAPSEILTIGHGAPDAEEHAAGHCG
ncbi:MAG TPA: cation diffusion facilitator family transporter [Actinospica sp.]|nr:cation diffusion facilitator family transporter [Actinospica sp.]